MVIVAAFVVAIARFGVYRLHGIKPTGSAGW
jgi:hypothetical protein